MPQDLNSLYEVFLQSAKVINEQQALRMKTELTEERLKQQKAQQDEKISIQKDILELKGQLAAQSQMNKDREFDEKKRQFDEEVARKNKEFEEREARLSANQASRTKSGNLLKLYEDQDTAMVLSGGAAPSSVNTTYPSFASTRMKDLETMRKSAQKVESGAFATLDSSIMDMLNKADPNFGSNPKEAATRMVKAITATIEWRGPRIRDSLLSNPFTPDDVKTSLRAFDVNKEVQQPTEGEDSALKGAADQATGKGTKSDTPNTAQTDKYLQQIATFSSEMLSKPESLNVAASEIATMLNERLAAKDMAGFRKISNAAAAKSEELKKKIADILKSRKK